jgi:antibiotic biosynthesis monooxygenase (ABM) superfamily enzyme
MLEPKETFMYPHVTQFETRRLDFERQLQSISQIDTDQSATEILESRSQWSRNGPRRYKLAVLTWGAAYAVITLILEVLGPTMASWPLEVRTLVLSLLMVASLTWLVMPAVTRVFRRWLYPAA